ncbi:HNH endonuclease signature motif containing protein [Angustibacter luteus]|uniref:HNH endonuclease signature motif containing protein n=1 Tax=Angustibacter luteus TaxID=658456 RepID=A0ABW1JC83_9ACTN
MAHRDQHCTYPGCQAPPPWCDAHHLIPFSEGGPTSVHNGALLCGRHHRHVHATGQTGHLLDGQIHWGTSPPDAPPAASVTRATRLLDDLTRRWRAPRPP